MEHDSGICQNCLLPIEKVGTSFPLRKNKIHPSIKRIRWFY